MMAEHNDNDNDNSNSSGGGMIISGRRKFLIVYREGMFQNDDRFGSDGRDIDQEANIAVAAAASEQRTTNTNDDQGGESEGQEENEEAAVPAAPAAAPTTEPTAATTTHRLHHNRGRRLTIWSFGRNVHEDPNCDLTIDLVGFRNEYEKRDIRKVDGRTTIIQNHMESHQDYQPLMNLVVQTIEENDDNVITSVAFCCSWGKHRSMAFAELLGRHEYYPRSRIKHAKLLAQTAAHKEKRDRRKKQKGRTIANRKNKTSGRQQ